MPDCAECARPLGRYRWRCKSCGACEECCECEELDPTFDADELGLDPESYDVALRERGIENA